MTLEATPTADAALKPRAMPFAADERRASHRLMITCSPPRSLLAARADLIVTGDLDLLTLNAYQNIPIITATEALHRIEART